MVQPTQNERQAIAQAGYSNALDMLDAPSFNLFLGALRERTAARGTILSEDVATAWDEALGF